MPIRRAIRFAKRHRFLAAATAVLMVGAGCIGAVRQTAQQLADEAAHPLSLPIRADQGAIDATSGTDTGLRSQDETNVRPA